MKNIKDYEKDVDVLDVIINKIANVNFELLSRDFIDDDILAGNDDGEKELEFFRLISILKEINIANVRANSIGASVERNQNTIDFISRGGFKHYYMTELERQQREDSRENLETELAKSNIEANKLNQKNSRFNKITSIIVIIVGLINLLVFVYQVFISKQSTNP